ncbi:EAL domain-containing response regulator [Achromobacter marplatensis]|uniref:EAL domain-containing response regulator n=1 Tax=Achromobacter marplatensis TaxID=470868 RepID=UPI0039F66DA0
MPRLNILIVDDHALQLEYMVHLMRHARAGHVETALNGWDALEKLRSHRFDLVITDLMMPGLDGVQLIQSLSELINPPAIALVSASPKRLLASACIVAKLLGLRVIAQICKPVSADDIDMMLKQLQQPQGVLLEPPRGISEDRDTLLSALDNGEIQAWFQPKLALIDDSVCGVEALARWVRDDGTISFPGEFLPSLSFHGLEERLLNSIVSFSIAAQKHWRVAGYSIPVSINLPTHLLDDRALPDRLLANVRAAGGDPESICFELTEGTTTSHLSDFHAGACRLRMMGFKLAQDDFGQGYSSIYNLLTVPFTELKIDRSLIQDCVNDDKVRAILDSAITLGRRLGIAVVAEGVETREQLELLRQLDCTAVQGFYVAEALDVNLMAIRLHGDCWDNSTNTAAVYKRLPDSGALWSGAAACQDA